VSAQAGRSTGDAPVSALEPIKTAMSNSGNGQQKIKKKTLRVRYFVLKAILLQYIEHLQENA
jgi:hypothetical protein